MGTVVVRVYWGPAQSTSQGQEGATASGPVLKGSQGKGVNRLPEVSSCLFFFPCSLDPTGFPVYIPHRHRQQFSGDRKETRHALFRAQLMDKAAKRATVVLLMS